MKLYSAQGFENATNTFESRKFLKFIATHFFKFRQLLNFDSRFVKNVLVWQGQFVE